MSMHVTDKSSAAPQFSQAIILWQKLPLLSVEEVMQAANFIYKDIALRKKQLWVHRTLTQNI